MRRTTVLSAAAALPLLFAGCASSPSSSDDSSGSGDAQMQAQDESASAEPEEPEKQTVSRDDVELKLRQTSKQCFGEAGCNVEYKVVPALLDLDPEQGFAEDYDITYEVTGGTDGSLSDTFVLYTDGQYDVPAEGFTSTANANAKLRVRVVSVTPTNQ